MVDDLEEQSSEGIDIQHYLAIVRRRHFHFLIPFFVAWAVVWAASWVLPPRYLSSTLILVEQPTMPQEYVKSNWNDRLQERMQSIPQQILSRTRLLHIIDQFNLYAGPRSKGSPDAKVDRMRKDIGIDVVRDERRQITAFNVSYISRDPHLAQAVTSELTNLLINENVEESTKQANDNTKFLEGQLETARKTLSEQEEKVREFKAQYVGEMPDQLASNLQILSGLQSQLQNEENALNTARQQRVYLQSMVDQYRTMQGSPKTSDGTPTVGLPVLDQELDRLKAQLADLSSHYTDRHPDVRNLKEQIAKTEKMRDQLVTSMKAKDAAGHTEAQTGAQTDGGDAESSSGTTDPTQATLLAPVQGQLKSNQVEIANREHSIAALKVKMDEYQGRLNQEPIREQQLADLTRGYDQSKSNYDDLLKKKNDSAMATSMVVQQRGERFQVIDAPSFPQRPDFPNRLKFCGIGLGIGLALGVVVVGAFEFMDDRMYDEKELKKLLPAEVIAEIPAIGNLADQQSATRKAWLGWATAAVVFVTILAGSAISFLRG